jgi:hypothetical protein
MQAQRPVRAIDAEAPIVIGGGGGSGTRVVAAIFLRLGFHLGSDRNSAEDNLLFTLLFKRPRWFARAEVKEFDRAIVTLKRGMLRGCSLSDLPVLLGGAKDMVLHSDDYALPRRLLWTVRRLRAAFRRPRHHGRAPGWGWKEPNSHIYIEHLARWFPRMRYIHVMRHGLDMAHSANQAQLRNWGSLYGVEHDSAGSAATRALQFWIRSNQAALSKAEKLLDERFLVVRFDDLCDRPRKEIQRLCDFVGVTVSEQDLDSLAALPQSPASRGRYRDRDLGQFDDASIAAVEALGFAVAQAQREAAA